MLWIGYLDVRSWWVFQHITGFNFFALFYMTDCSISRKKPIIFLYSSQIFLEDLFRLFEIFLKFLRLEIQPFDAKIQFRQRSNEKYSSIYKWKCTFILSIMGRFQAANWTWNIGTLWHDWRLYIFTSFYINVVYDLFFVISNHRYVLWIWIIVLSLLKWYCFRYYWAITVTSWYSDSI